MGYLQFCRKGGNRKKEVKWGQTMRVQKNIAQTKWERKNFCQEETFRQAEELSYERLKKLMHWFC